MTRVVSVYLPKWATDRHRRASGGDTHPADEPLVLAGSDGRRRVVLSANDAGLGLGLHPGTPLAKAQALVPGLRVEDADPKGDIDALERLAFWALRYSPVAAADAPDGIVLDVEGAAHLMGGEKALAEDLQQRLTAAGYACRVAIADTWGVAHALARFGSSEISVAPPGALQQVIEAMPLPALRLEPAVCAELRALGFERIADLISQPRAPLALRFGSGLWRRIDQALGLTS